MATQLQSQEPKTLNRAMLKSRRVRDVRCQILNGILTRFKEEQDLLRYSHILGYHP